MAIHVYGIRHHGPGCARSLRRALDELAPDVVVMEGPADAQDYLSWAAHAGMKPPVALLIYPPDEPRRGVYFPLTVFSPEWQTLQWAASKNVPVRLMDLPESHQFAMQRVEEVKARRAADEERKDEERKEQQPKEERQEDQQTEQTPSDTAAAAEPKPDTAPNGAVGASLDGSTWRSDPLALLAEAAGYKDHELWWEHQVERRSDATGLFAAILEAMRSVREAAPEVRERDLMREAFMRKTLRGVVKEGFEKIAVVCGAWHAPVLDTDAVAGKQDGCKVKDDTERLAGLPKVKTTATWIPWTYSRLTFRSGYGAGVEAPGWYAHLWVANDAAPTRWLTTAARLLREKDLEGSPAGVIEALRLADALAALREIRSPGLAELNEAILAVLCHGEPSPLALIRNRLEIGDVMGAVPDETPTVPLARDLAQQQTSLRLKPSSENKLLDLDVRKENDLARSWLLHRLNLLGIGWGEHEHSGGRSSTFHEIWRIEWKPEFEVAIIEANVWGNTVEAAAGAKAVDGAAKCAELADVTALLDSSILAGLAAVVDPLLARIQAMAAVGADVRHLMDALLPLARISRYGDVRGTGASHVGQILSGMFERVVVGLGAACAALDDDAALRMAESMGRTAEALQIVNRDGLHGEWQNCVRRLMHRSIHPLLCGWCCRLLLDARVLADEELYRLARLNLSPANPSAACAAWATGLLRGSGLVILQHEALWQVFDRWLSELSAEVFTEMLPLVRRAFAGFTGPERRQLGDKVKHLRSERAPPRKPSAAPEWSKEIDHDRAARVLPVLKHILGVN
jgi:hypothetical protein